VNGRSPTLETGNAADAGAATRGWFVGDLAAWAASRGETLDATPTQRQSEQLYVKWSVHRPGEERPSWADADPHLSLSLLVDGDAEFRFRTASGETDMVRLARQGDYVIWNGATYAHWWRTTSGCTLVTIRWPLPADDLDADSPPLR